MNGEVRPDLSKSKLYSFLCLLALGVFSLYVTSIFIDPESYVLDQSTSTLTKRTKLLSIILGGISTALVVITLYELIKLGVHYLIWCRTKKRVIERFFGKGASVQPENAEIIAQSDPLRVMLGDLVDSDSALAAKPSHRLYKARHWVNKYDIEGGRAIIKMFRKEGLGVPTLKPVEHDRRPKPSAAPFKIILGLGFTNEAKQLIGQFSAWLRVDFTENGDALFLKSSLLPGNWRSRLVGEESEDGFTSLLPKGWSLETWLQRPTDSRDYALILRHASEVGARACVYFWVAGFTDRGTAAAGRFLAENWELLDKRFVAKRNDANPHGNFMILIEGPSEDRDPKMGKWTQVDAFEVTPRDIQRKAGISWSSRDHLGADV